MTQEQPTVKTHAGSLSRNRCGANGKDQVNEKIGKLYEIHDWIVRLDCERDAWLIHVLQSAADQIIRKLDADSSDADNTQEDLEKTP